jgi:hypothetical protein
VSSVVSQQYVRPTGNFFQMRVYKYIIRPQLIPGNFVITILPNKIVPPPLYSYSVIKTFPDTMYLDGRVCSNPPNGMRKFGVGRFANSHTGVVPKTPANCDFLSNGGELINVQQIAPIPLGGGELLL